jgi:hypothetical protein
MSHLAGEGPIMDVKHSTANEQLYSPHPSIFNFTDVVKKFQGTTYITMRSLNVNAPLSKVEREKLQLLSEQFQKYQSLV